MSRLRADSLHRHDIVLVESFISRWPIDETEIEKQNKYKYPRTWSRWRAELKLEAISLIFPGSVYMGSSRDGEDLDV